MSLYDDLDIDQEKSKGGKDVVGKYYYLVFFPQIINQSDQWKFEIFRRFIGVDWSLMYEDNFHH